VDRDRLAGRLSPPIRCAPGTNLVLLIAYMCPCSLEVNISSSFFLHLWQGDNRKSQDLAWQLAPCQESRIKRQQTVSCAGCKVLAPNASFLLASMLLYCRFRPIECCYSQSVSVSVPQDNIRGSAKQYPTFVSECFAGSVEPDPAIKRDGLHAQVPPEREMMLSNAVIKRRMRESITALRARYKGFGVPQFL